MSRVVSKLFALIASAVLFVPSASTGEQVRVRHIEGVVHGFLALRNLDGSTLASGELIQTIRDARVTSRLIFRFNDGSLHDETAVYSQQQTFRLLTYHLVQTGRSFPQPSEMSIDALKGQVTTRYTDDHGAQQVDTEHLDLPPDVANGLVLTLLKNVEPGRSPTAVSFVAATPKPRLVKLEVSIAGEESFTIGGAPRGATHYVLKVKIGGIAGMIAPLVGKRPPDSHVWVLGGEAPAFVKAEQSLYNGGPTWRIELVSPVWPQRATTGR